MDSTRLDDLSEISIIEAPKPIRELKSPEQGMKPPQNTPRSKVKPPKKLFDVEPSPSVITKKKPSPKSNKKKNETPSKETSNVITRPQRNVRRKQIIYSDDDDDSDKENESDWSEDESYSGSASPLLTEDESDNEHKEPEPKPKSVRKKAPASTNKRPPTKKADKNKLIFLDLSSEEIVRVDENFHANVSEDDLANITRKFLETDLGDGE